MVTLFVCGRNLKFDVHSSVLDLGITIAGSQIRVVEKKIKIKGFRVVWK